MEQIRPQIKTRLESFQSEFSESILPVTSLELQEFLQLSRDKIKEKYKQRYLSYRRLKYGNKDLSEIEVNDIKKYLRFLNRLDSVVDNLENDPNLNTHPLRLKMVKGLRDGLEQGYRHGYIASPTQSGKTEIMIQVLNALVGIKTFVLCDTDFLTDQTFKRLKENGLEVKAHYGKLKQGLDADVVVTTYGWFQRNIKNGRLKKEDLNFVIADEGHLTLGTVTKKIMKDLMLENINILALTASPDYSEKKTLLSLYGYEYCRILIKDAAEQGLIANFKCIFAFTDTDLSDVKFENGEYNEDEYIRAISNEKRMQSIWEYWKTYLQDKKGLIFASRVKYAEKLQEFIEKKAKEEGLEAKIGVITGQLNLNEKLEEKER
jgi:superfamily II DNA or RNA helicase